MCLPFSAIVERTEKGMIIRMGLTRKQWMMLVVIVIGTFVTILNQTLVTPALPAIMAEMSGYRTKRVDDFICFSR